MNDNPYEPPAGVRRGSEFYTDDITLLPVAAIWRMLRRQPFLGRAALFPYFLGRKALNLRFPANHAMGCPARLDPVPEGDVPQEVRHAMTPFREACSASGMNHVCTIRPRWIGNKQGLYGVWLDSAGTTYCNITWIDLRLGSFHKSKVVFACHSLLASGVELNTAAVTPQDWIPEVIPPDQDFMRLPPDVPPAFVIARHLERIADRTDVVRFDADSLMTEILHRSQKLFDYLVAKGIYAPISAEETQRLMAKAVGAQLAK